MVTGSLAKSAALSVMLLAGVAASGCGKVANESQRTSESGAKTPSADDSVARENEFNIEGDSVNFELALPDVAVEADANVAEPAVDEAMPTASQPEAIPPVQSARIHMECRLKTLQTLLPNRAAEFKLTLEEASTDRASVAVEHAVIYNCGRFVKVSIKGLKAGHNYRLRGLLVIGNRFAFGGETTTFTVDSGRVRLVLRRVTVPSGNGVDVDVVVKDQADHDGGGEDLEDHGCDDADVACTMEYAPTTCSAAAAKVPVCVAGQPCPMIAPLLLIASGSNQCQARAALMAKACKRGLAPTDIIESSIKCVAKPGQ